MGNELLSGVSLTPRNGLEEYFRAHKLFGVGHKDWLPDGDILQFWGVATSIERAVDRAQRVLKNHGGLDQTVARVSTIPEGRRYRCWPNGETKRNGKKRKK